MAFNCENSQAPTNCGYFVPKYIKNLKYVYLRLAAIISEGILPPDVVPDTPLQIADNDCVCYPLCSDEGPTPCVATTNAKVFNCSVWNEIKKYLVIDTEGESSDGNGGYLSVLAQTLKCIVANVEGLNHGLKSQFERFICIVENLRKKIYCVCCNDDCPELLGDLFCVLLQILNELSSAISKAASLTYFADCYANHDNKVIPTFFECVACEFVNDLCDLEKLLAELGAVLMAFSACDVEICTPCYTAPCAPKKHRPMCPPPMMDGPKGYGGGSCGCSCKK